MCWPCDTTYRIFDNIGTVFVNTCMLFPISKLKPVIFKTWKNIGNLIYFDVHISFINLIIMFLYYILQYTHHYCNTFITHPIISCARLLEVMCVSLPFLKSTYDFVILWFSICPVSSTIGLHTIVYLSNHVSNYDYRLTFVVSFVFSYTNCLNLNIILWF